MRLFKQTFFCSDHHIGHKNVIAFDNRPFDNLDEMHHAIIKRHNDSVPTDSVTYFLGDFSFDFDMGKEVLSQMNGAKVLILGNHDFLMDKSYRMGFDVVVNSSSIIVSKKIVTMSHCPLRGIPREECSHMRGYVEGDCWHGENRLDRHSIPSYGDFHLHGHLHSKKNKMVGNQFDVGLPCNNYTPVSISAIESWIAKFNEKAD